MSNLEHRRKFLLGGAVATGGLLAARSLSAQNQAPVPPGHAGHGEMKMPMPKDDSVKADDSEMDMQMEMDSDYPRMHPGVGGPVGSPSDRGKLVAGLRDISLPPVPIHSPDLKTLPWEMVDGAKEFHLTAEPVRREILPGIWMDTYGYNGGMPGPTIEVNQGDRVRIVAKNNLPEGTSMHWHGLEVPVEMDGVPELVQSLIEPGDSFTYEFVVHQEGTFFYHSHVGMQETMGMVGLFIVYPKTESLADRRSRFLSDRTRVSTSAQFVGSRHIVDGVELPNLQWSLWSLHDSNALQAGRASANPVRQLQRHRSSSAAPSTDTHFGSRAAKVVGFPNQPGCPATTSWSVSLKLAKLSSSPTIQATGFCIVTCSIT